MPINKEVSRIASYHINPLIVSTSALLYQSMAMKSIILISLLVVVLIATQADAQLLRANISGIVTCSVNGSVNGTAPPFANATVQLTCGGNVIASAVTNAQGAFSIILSLVRLITTNTLSSPCMVRVVTPLSSCNATLPSTGILQAPLQLAGNTIGGLLNILNLIPGVFTFISDIIV